MTREESGTTNALTNTPTTTKATTTTTTTTTQPPTTTTTQQSTTAIPMDEDIYLRLSVRNSLKLYIEIQKKILAK